MGAMTTLHLAEIVDSTPSEGPGSRFAVWAQGCLRCCEGCCNPEMFDTEGGFEMPLQEVMERLERAVHRVEGISLLGGEPFLQAAALAPLAERARARGLGVVVFTGYLLEELKASAVPGTLALLAVTDLLVDGPYDRECASSRRRWIGSDNQRMHFLTDRYRDNADITEDHTQSVHVRVADGEMQVSGWPEMADALGSKDKE